MAPIVHLAVEERIGRVHLARPERRNALTGQAIAELVTGLAALDEDERVDVLLLTAEDPAFCAGLDLKDLEQGQLDISALTRSGDPWPLVSKPLVGSVNGPAVTGGLELALKCDILIASERASFGDTHARVGVMPFWGLTAALPRSVGTRQALFMSLTGTFLSAADAFRLGLVAEVVPHDELAAAAWKVASDIASADQRIVRGLLAAYRERAAGIDAGTLAAEQRRALDHQGAGLDLAELARRRPAIVERGRTQA